MPDIDDDPQYSTPKNMRGATDSTDPTYNVRMLMEANINSLKELTQTEIDNARNIALEKIAHVEETQKLHVFYQEKLTVAESKRIDAIRSVDVAAAQIDRERTAQQAVVLANQVVVSAETLRTLVASTATTQATAQAQSTSQLNDRIVQLEKAMNQGAGKIDIEEKYPSRLEALERSMNQGVGKTDQSAVSRLTTVAIVTVVGTIISMGIGLIGVVLAVINMVSKLP